MQASEMSEVQARAIARWERRDKDMQMAKRHREERHRAREAQAMVHDVRALRALFGGEGD